MKTVNWIIILSAVLLLSACARSASVQTLPSPAPDQNLEAKQHGLSIAISRDEYNEGTPIFETILRNDSTISYEYGEYFHIEVLKNNQWYTLTHSDAVFYENPRFTNLGHLLAPGENVHQTLSVETLRITLPPGQYRLVKIFLKPTAPYYAVAIAVPFTVETANGK